MRFETAGLLDPIHEEAGARVYFILGGYAAPPRPPAPADDSLVAARPAQLPPPAPAHSAGVNPAAFAARCLWACGYAAPPDPPLTPRE